MQSVIGIDQQQGQEQTYLQRLSKFIQVFIETQAGMEELEGEQK
jgi:hypothetical protein